MKYAFFSLSLLTSVCFARADDLTLAQSLSEKLYVSIAQTLPGQLNEKDQLRSECSYRDLYITCRISDDAGDVGYTHGITVKFDHYGHDLAVNSIQYFAH